MASQTITGYAWMERNLDRYFRTVANPGLVDAQTKADAITEAEQVLHDLALESGVGWSIKTKLVDDVGGGLGKSFGQNGRFLFITEDLGLTDLIRVKNLFREDGTGRQLRLDYLGSNDDEDDRASTPGEIYGRGAEHWFESGDLNADGDQEMGIRVLNYNTLMPGSSLRIDYWYTPPQVETSFFTDTDASGDLTKSPSLPRQTWMHILNMAKMIIAEQTEDTTKLRALRQRYYGPNGVLERIREDLSHVQSGGTEYVQNTFRR